MFFNVKKGGTEKIEIPEQVLGTKLTKRVNPHKIPLQTINEDSDGDWALSQDTKIRLIKSNRQLSKQRSKKRKSWSVNMKKNKHPYSLKLFD